MNDKFKCHLKTLLKCRPMAGMVATPVKDWGWKSFK